MLPGGVVEGRATLEGTSPAKACTISVTDVIFKVSCALSTTFMAWNVQAYGCPTFVAALQPLRKLMPWSTVPGVAVLVGVPAGGMGVNVAVAVGGNGAVGVGGMGVNVAVGVGGMGVNVAVGVGGWA